MNKLFTLFIFSLLALSLVGNSLVHASGTDECVPSATKTCPTTTTSITLDNPFKATCGTGTCGVLDLLKAIVNNIILPIGGVLAVLGFIWSGFMYVMARGNPAAIGKAHTALLYTAIGTAVLLGAFAITDLITGTISQLGGPKL